MYYSLFIDFQSSCHYFAFTFDYVLLETIVGEEPLQNGAKYSRKSIIIKLSKTNKINMPKYSRSNECFSSSRCSHGCYEYQIDQLLEWFFFVSVIIPSSLIDHLSENFNRWLCSPLFLLGHIQIIHKDNSFSCFGSKYASSLFIDLPINDILSLCACSLCTESHFNTLVDRFVKTIH